MLEYWYIIVFIVLGIIISKEFRVGIVTTVGSAITFTLPIIFGVIYFIPHALYLGIKAKSFPVFYKHICRTVEGFYSTIGNILHEGFAIRYDELGNVFGEVFEDTITSAEDTKFGEKNTTMSAAIGHIEYNSLHINKFGKFISRSLNFVFQEKFHAVGSWKRKLALKKLEELNLKGK